MIDLYYWNTPNGHKITIFLEESALPYHLIPINIGRGEQFSAEFLQIAPNNRIPAIVDHDPRHDDGDDGGDDRAALSIFESGAILLYLAEKTGQFLSDDFVVKNDVLQWLFWQMGGLGPMLGQMHHFAVYAEQKIPYAIERYRKEASRLYAVLNKQLEGKDYICGQYSIADMACYPWTVSHEQQGQALADFPHLMKWYFKMKAREAVGRAYAIADKLDLKSGIDANAAKIMFGQDSTVVERN